MSGKKSAVAKKAEEWLQYADEDLRLAKHAFKLKTSAPFKLIAYHAQQCVEKCLKAYLVFNDIDFPFTHNISALLELCPPSADWSKELDDAKVLSAYAVTARYRSDDAGKIARRQQLAPCNGLPEMSQRGQPDVMRDLRAKQ